MTKPDLATQLRNEREFSKQATAELSRSLDRVLELYNEAKDALLWVEAAVMIAEDWRTK